MGIYDRDYYRKGGPSISDAWALSGRACRWIVLANVVFFIAQLVTRQGGELGPVTDWLAMKPQEAFFRFQIWRFITGAFLHDPTMWWTHIFFNMLLLWFLGPDVEDLYGSREFLAFYLLAGTIGNVCWGLATLLRGPQGPPFPLALGASGAVLGVMILAAFHYPHRTVYLMWFIPIPLWALAALTVVIDLYGFLSPRPDGAFRPEVAVAAHLGGAAFGFLYYQLNWRILRGWQSLNNVLKKTSRPKLRVYREEEAVATSVSRSAPDEQLEAKADEVLAKVGQHGMDSLTAEEREILQKASEAYRKRRG